MPQTLAEPKTLAEKVWERHVVHRAAGEPDLLYVDLHLVHEVTSPQAFDALRLAGRGVRRPDLTVATMDHNVPTTDGPVTDATSARQMDALAKNAKEFGITIYPWVVVGCWVLGVRGIAWEQRAKSKVLRGWSKEPGVSSDSDHGFES